MGSRDYQKMFDLKPAECGLKILICTKNKEESQLLRVRFVDPILLPHLPFEDQSFDLVLCPSVLLVHEMGSLEEADKKALLELARVGGEVRVFPLVDKAGQPTYYLGSLMHALQQEGMGIELRHVIADPHGSNAMLRFWKDVCTVSK